MARIEVPKGHKVSEQNSCIVFVFNPCNPCHPCWFVVLLEEKLGDDQARRHRYHGRDQAPSEQQHLAGMLPGFSPKTKIRIAKPTPPHNPMPTPPALAPMAMAARRTASSRTSDNDIRLSLR
jgi:hypothetical protein